MTNEKCVPTDSFARCIQVRHTEKVSGCLFFLGIFGAIAASANQAAEERSTSMLPWSSPTGAQCGQECAYAKARENQVIQAFYYYRLVETAERAAASSDPASHRQVIEAAGGLCNRDLDIPPNATAQDSQDISSRCVLRLRAVAFASIQRVRSAITLNNARRDSLMSENGVIPLDPSYHSSYEPRVGQSAVPRGLMDPSVLSAEDLIRLQQVGDDLERNIRSNGTTHANIMSESSLDRDGNLWLGAQEEYANWMRTAAQPQPTDFVAFRNNPTTGRSSEIPQRECVAPRYQFINNICYDQDAYRIALTQYQQTHGHSSDPNHPTSGLQEKLNNLADEIAQFRGNRQQLQTFIQSLQARVIRPGPNPHPTPTGLQYRAYTETRGAVGRAVDTTLQTYQPPRRTPPTTRPTDRRLATGRPNASGSTRPQQQPPTAPIGPSVADRTGGAGLTASTDAQADQLFQAGQNYQPPTRQAGDRRSIYLEMSDTALQNLMLNADGPGGRRSGQSVIHYTNGSPVPQSTPHPEPNQPAGGVPAAPPLPARSTAGTPPRPARPGTGSPPTSAPQSQGQEPPADSEDELESALP
jgi:hypothetical protein